MGSCTSTSEKTPKASKTKTKITTTQDLSKHINYTQQCDSKILEPITEESSIQKKQCILCVSCDCCQEGACPYGCPRECPCFQEHFRRAQATTSKTIIAQKQSQSMNSKHSRPVVPVLTPPPQVSPRRGIQHHRSPRKKSASVALAKIRNRRR